MVETLNPNAKPGEPGYTSIFSGGLLVQDQGGNVVGNISYGTEDAQNALFGMPVYKTAQGNFTTKVPDIYAEFDKATGNVVVHAPKEVMEMESFKTNVLNNSAIKQLSAAYKVDPNYAFPDPEDDSKTISVQEELSKLNEGLRDYKDNVQKLVDERENLARNRDTKYRNLSLDNMVTALSFAQNNNDRQVIPNYLVDLFSEFESWDADSQTVSKDELMRKWWSYDVSDREQLLTNWIRLQAELKYADTRNPEDENVPYSMQKSGLPDPSDTARALSLEKFLEANDANTNTVQGVNRKVRDIVGNELYSVAAQFSSGLLSAAAAATSLLGLAKNPFSEGLASAGAELEKSVEQLNDETEVFNKGAAVIGTTFQTLGNLGAILTADVLVEDVAGLVAKGVGKIDSWAKALEVVSNNSKNIAKGAEFMLKALPTRVVANILSTAVDLLNEGSGLAKFLGEVVIEAAVDNPQVMADFMSNENNLLEVKQALMEEATYNGLGLAAGLGISKGLTSFASTSTGRAINAALASINAKISVKVGDKVYDIRSAIAKAPLEEALGAKAEKALDEGAFTRAYNYRRMQQTVSAQNELREARRVLAGMSIRDTDAIVEQIGKIQALDAAYDLAVNGSRRMYSAIVSYDPILRASNKATSESLDRVIRLQKRAGMTAAKGAKYGTSGLSEVASQYISLSQRMHVAETAADIAESSLNKAAKEALPVYQKQMKELLDQITPELKLALDEYVGNLKTFYKDFNDWAIAEGLLSEETIQSYRANPLFADNNYMRVMVEEDAAKIRTQRADGLISEDNLLDIKSLQLPAKEQQFVDPEIVRTWYGMEIAKSYNAQNLAKSALEATGATPTIMASNAEIKVARDVSANATEVTKAAAKQYSQFVSEVESSFTLKQVGELNEARLTMMRKSVKQKTATQKLDIAYRKAGVYNLSNSDLSTILKEGGYKEGSAYNELQVRIGEGLENNEEVQRIQTEIDDLKRQLRNAERRKSSTYKEKKSLRDKIQRRQEAQTIAGNPQKNAYDAWYSEASDDIKRWLREQRNVNLSAKMDVPNGNSKVTYEQFSELQKTDNFGKEFDRQTIFSSKKMMDSKKVVTAGKDAKKNSAFLEDLTEPKKAKIEAKDETAEAKKLWRKEMQVLKEGMRDSLDNFVENVSKDGEVIQATKAMRDYGQGDPETIAKYLTLQELRKPKNLNDIKDKLKKQLRKQIPKSAKKSMVDEYEKSIDEAIDALIREEYNDARLALDVINSKVINKKEWAEEIKSLHKKISDSSTISNVIKVSDGNGGIQLVEVNPNLAFLYNYRPRRVMRDGLLDKAFRGTSKLFRFGQTTFSAKSFVMQGFRDSGNAYFMGNAWRDISSAADNLVDVFGENIVKEIKEFQPEYYEKLVKQVSESGAEATTENLARAEVSNIRAYGEQISPASTETGLYTRAGNDEAFERMRTTTKNFADKLDSIFNGKREEYLRNRVFMNALNTAMEQGHTYKESQAIATQMMQNATTNFSRSVFYLDSLAENVPYIKSAINGTTSFWRMFSLDPVGVTGRLAGGLFMPYTYLLGQSLSDPENAEIYANIPEYEKRDNLVFVVRGQKISIPIPQELGPIIAPFRHFVEYLWGAQKNNFWDLLGNDILGLSPIDLTGFSNVDVNLMTSDPTITDRLSRGTMRLISQMAPVPVKAAWIAMTQTDPYTGKRIADTSWTYQDPETGEEVPMGYNQGAFAEGLASLLHNDNAALVSKVVSSVFGTTGEDVLDALAGLVQGSDPLSSIGNNLVVPQFNNAVSALYNETYDRTAQLWRQAIRELEIEKQQITESEEWKKLHSAMSQATNETALQKFRAQRQNMIDSFNQKVVDTAQRLQSIYGGTLDRTRLASITQLLNFSTNADFDQSNQYLQDLASEVYYAGSNQAVRTMQELGVRGATDYSIFGYFKRNSDGSVGVKYNSPTAILDMRNTIYGAKDIELANIKSVLENAGITRGKMFSDEYYAAKTKAEKKAYKANWNKQVLRALAPYINSVGVDEIINNTEISDYLDQYIFVDNPYKAKDYIKKLFKGE